LQAKKLLAFKKKAASKKAVQKKDKGDH